MGGYRASRDSRYAERFSRRDSYSELYKSNMRLEEYMAGIIINAHLGLEDSLREG